MSKSSQIYWKDKSATTHRFWIYPRATKFNEPCPGIYIYAKQTSPHKWLPIYIGQAQNVNARLADYEQQQCVDQNGATHIHVSIITDAKSRLRIHKDLIEQWKPVCNTPIGLSAEGVSTCDRQRDQKREIYNVPREMMNAIWLNEFLKEHGKVEEQKATIAQFKKEIASLTATVERHSAQIQRMRAQLEPNRHALDTASTIRP